MSVLAVGLSHRSSPVALLERAALSGEERLKLMSEMAASPAVGEVLMVSTCNRTEVYAEVDRFHPALNAITSLLSERTGVSMGELTEHAYVHYEERAVQHLFSVACGLDSMVVGEGQILGQVRNALKDAQHGGTLGRVLNDLGQRALRVGKRAHTETHLDHAGADMVTLGLEVALERLRPGAGAAGAVAAAPASCPAGAAGPLADEADAAVPEPQALTGVRVLVLGAGSMSALAANTVARQGATSVAVANRTAERAERLAECLTEAYEPMVGRAVPFDRAASAVADADLVISCTGAQGLVLTAEDVRAALEAAPRRTRPVVFLDLALPRDVDEAVRDLPGAELVDIEDLRRAAAEGAPGADGGSGAVPVVRRIVEEEVAEYEAVRRADLVAPTVVALRAKANEVLEGELSRLEGRLPDLGDREREEITRAMRRVVDKLMHQPTVRVKELAARPGGDAYGDALRELFGLDPAAPDAVRRPEPVAGEDA
ncbi:glutamyl-tRNA reductase [Nocardiopsis sp. RSe5-2]|uniref:Glutamyl-tRNA reductase n=1 Tax=Nocardiopsis endophytica TaxID=3018445 RepID=A0ABT4U1D5_9ACTN|nr:glutamyl-tRNA reductase [Nocardiopsis endophytica]MDA2810750.1 glutamyl-tRNA reductase [Nocardiopsis endophytica]